MTRSSATEANARADGHPSRSRLSIAGPLPSSRYAGIGWIRHDRQPQHRPPVSLRATGAQLLDGAAVAAAIVFVASVIAGWVAMIGDLSGG